LMIFSADGKRFIAYIKDSWLEVKKSSLAKPPRINPNDPCSFWLRFGYGALFMAN